MATVAIVVAAISAVLALTSAVTVQGMQRRANVALERDRHELALDREVRSRNAQLAELVQAYQNPVLRSAYDLQSRIYNIHRGFRGRPGEEEYFTSNTAYVIAEFFGWMEIVRREMQFLDLGVEQRTASLKDALDRVQGTFASTSSRRQDRFYVYRGQQRAIGELMIVELADPMRSGLRSTCLGYAMFVERHTENPLAGWMGRIEARVADLTAPDIARLVEVQHALIDLIDLLDPGHIRFRANRGKILTVA